jgi:glycosyltransferase involved in cell wall biosynthesis
MSPPDQRRLKICHVVATTEGASWLVDQLRELRDRCGCDVAAVLNGNNGTLVERLRAEAIPVHAANFDFTSSPHLFGLPRKVLALARLFRREKFDVVQTHLFHSMVIGRMAAWIADVPVRASMIAGPFHLEAYTPRWIDRATCWMDTTVIPSCEHSRSLYRELGVPERRLALIYYGPDDRKFDPSITPRADLRRQYGWPDDTPLVGMIAYFYTTLGANRWTPPALHGKAGKGHEDLIRAAPTVLRDFPATKFLLVGKGWQEGGQALLQRMQSLVAELGLQDSVIFTGFRTDVPQIYRDLDVSIQPSLNENLGGTIESLLMECPTLATRIGGLTDSVLDGETGVLVNPGDPSDLANGILRLLRNPAAARELGKAGRARMLARFTLSTTVRDLDNLYRRLSNRGGYRPYVTLWRLVVAGPFCLGVALRFLVLDAYLLPRWDQGWRPWHRGSLMPPRMWLYRGYALLNRVAPSFGLRSKLSAMRTMLRMWLYRGYALLNRVAPSFGLRSKLSAMRTMVRMWLYRSYALLNRVAPSFGLRRKIANARNWLNRFFG